MLGTHTIKITPDILVKVCEIDEFKGFWTGMEAHTTGLNMLKDVATFGSNFQKIFHSLKGQTLTPAMMRTLHATLTKGSGPTPYKMSENVVTIMRDGHFVGSLEAVPPEQAEPLTEKLVSWLNSTLEKRDMHPLLAIAIFTAVFLQISPFAEENLKIARFLITVLMLKSGYSYAPYVPVDRFVNDRAEILFQSLQINQQSLETGQPDWNPWLNCFLSLLVEQKDALKGRMFEKNKDLSHLPTLSAKILKLFEHNNRLQMKQIVKLTNGRRSTIKLRLGEMVEGGYVKRYGNARATWYSLV